MTFASTIRVGALVSLILSCGKSRTGEEGETAARSTQAVGSKSKKEQIEVRDSIVRFLVLGEDTLSLAGKDSFRSFGRRWGLAPVEKSEGSDPADAVRAVCYLLVEADQQAFLILRADPHMDYPTILGFTLSEQAPANWSTTTCRRIEMRLALIRTRQGLHLGLPTDSALAAMGVVNPPQPRALRFEFQGEGVVDSAAATPDLPAGTPFTIGATTELVQQSGRITAITAWYVEGL